MNLMELLTAATTIDAHIANVLWGLAIVVILSMVLERALQMPFEWGPIQGFIETKKLRAPIAVIVAALICSSAGFDLISVIASRNATTWHGVLITAALIAGGSKGAILLFQGILGFAKENVDAKVKGVAQAVDATVPRQPAADGPSWRGASTSATQ